MIHSIASPLGLLDEDKVTLFRVLVITNEKDWVECSCASYNYTLPNNNKKNLSFSRSFTIATKTYALLVEPGLKKKIMRLWHLPFNANSRVSVSFNIILYGYRPCIQLFFRTHKAHWWGVSLFFASLGRGRVDVTFTLRFC